MNRSEAGKFAWIKRGDHLRAVFAKQFRERLEAYDNNPKQCRFCSKAISYAKRQNDFCTHSCGAKFNNTRKYSVQFCRKCKQNPRVGGRWYCNDCKKPIHKEWGDPTIRKFACRRLLVRDFGAVCSSCKNTEWMGQPIPLEIDHIDGNSDNWAKENVRLLCPLCHALTPTYKGKNTFHGSSRQRRRLKRYHEGKTY